MILKEHGKGNTDFCCLEQADSHLLSKAPFVVTAALCLLTGMMTDGVGIVLFRVKYSPVQDLSSLAKRVISGSRQLKEI